MARIEVVDVSQVRTGEYVCEGDDDRLTTTEAVNRDYDADDQSWHHVVKTEHKADVSRLTVTYPGEPVFTSGWAGGLIWRKVDDEGKPVTKEVTA